MFFVDAAQVIWLRIPTNSDLDVRLSQWLLWAARALDGVDLGIHLSNRGPDPLHDLEAFLDHGLVSSKVLGSPGYFFI